MSFTTATNGVTVSFVARQIRTLRLMICETPEGNSLRSNIKKTKVYDPDRGQPWTSVHLSSLRAYV